MRSLSWGQKPINLLKKPQRNFGKHISHRFLNKTNSFRFLFFFLQCNSHAPWNPHTATSCTATPAKCFYCPKQTPACYNSCTLQLLQTLTPMHRNTPIPQIPHTATPTNYDFHTIQLLHTANSTYETFKFFSGSENSLYWYRAFFHSYSILASNFSSGFSFSWESRFFSPFWSHCSIVFLHQQLSLFLFNHVFSQFSFFTQQTSTKLKNF